MFTFRDGGRCECSGRRVVLWRVERLVRRGFEAVRMRDLTWCYSHFSTACRGVYLGLERVIWKVLVARRASRNLANAWNGEVLVELLDG